ncbi:MAG: hypothetical protein ABIT01_04290 [Thermoanaerobaculia bacterium]
MNGIVNEIDWPLELSRILVNAGLAVWIGGTLLAIAVAVTLFASLPSRSQAGEIFGAILHILDRGKFIAAGGLLIGVLLEVQASGSALATRHIVRDTMIFVLIASHVYAVMVVQPKMRYYREKIVDLDAASLQDPWRLKFQAAHRKSERVTGAGLVLAVATLVIG